MGERNPIHRSECPHPAPCWCPDCKRAYHRVYLRSYRPAIPPCTGCGAERIGYNRSSRYCGDCSFFFRGRPFVGTDGVCRFCHKITLRNGGRGVGRLYCDNNCRYHHSQVGKLRTMPAVCKCCFKDFEANIAQGQRYCSRRCAQLMRSQLTIWHNPDRCYIPHCEDCGQVGGFNPFRGFICPTCAFARMERNRHKGQAKREAAMRGGDRSIHWRRLGDRDCWRCHLCEGTVPKCVGSSKKRNGATVDHLIPLCDGGSHEWDNVALAHWSCNISRGARSTERGVQLRLVG